MAGNEGGRPTVMTDEVLRKLEAAFMYGLSDRQACLFADIGESTLYDYQKERPEFSERKALLKEGVKMRARINIAESIRRGDIDTSKWYLEKRDAKFNPKQQVEMTRSLDIGSMSNEQLEALIRRGDELESQSQD